MDKKDSSIDILQKIAGLIDSGEDFAVAVVLKAEGSTPRKAGVWAIIDKSGKITGTLGGGVVEAEAQRQAIQSCSLKKPVIFNIELQGTDSNSVLPICGGNMRIFIDPTISRKREFFSQVAGAIRLRKKGVMLLNIKGIKEIRSDYKWYTEDSITSDIGFPGVDEICSCLNQEMPKHFMESSQIPAAGTEVFVQPIIPKPLLVIAGGGHIGQALALQANLVGFDITVIDDRAEFTDSDLFPKETKTICGGIAEQLAEMPMQNDTYIVIVTRGHEKDAEALQACIKKSPAYIGMIGSKRKVALIRAHFIQSGISTPEEFDRIFSPIGLDIGAVTVPEIAASITAELIAVRRMGLVRKPSNKAVPL
jgi:xanthine dehydrogenase accessory factor